MQGFTIYVYRDVEDNVPHQVCGIDTKYFPSGTTVKLGHDLTLVVSAYKEINKEPLWKRLRRWLLIREANFRLWITSRAERGSSDIQTRTPHPVTDVVMHAPLTSSQDALQNKQALNETITNGLAGFLDESIPQNVSFEPFHYHDPSPDMWWSCKQCKSRVFLGICNDCGIVTEF